MYNLFVTIMKQKFSFGKKTYSSRKCKTLREGEKVRKASLPPSTHWDLDLHLQMPLLTAHQFWFTHTRKRHKTLRRFSHVSKIKTNHLWNKARQTPHAAPTVSYHVSVTSPAPQNQTLPTTTNYKSGCFKDEKTIYVKHLKRSLDPWQRHSK